MSSSAADVEERQVAASPEAATGPSFARGLCRIAAADVSSANTVRLLHDGPATFAAMLHAIRSAERCIHFECYIFRSDDVGREFADALIEAVQRGVEVKLLIDWIGVRGTSKSMIRQMQKSGVQLAYFNPPGFRR